MSAPAEPADPAVTILGEADTSGGVVHVGLSRAEATTLLLVVPTDAGQVELRLAEGQARRFWHLVTEAVEALDDDPYQPLALARAWPDDEG